jgi:hypothetical protein
MNYLTYIENIIFNNSSVQEQEQFEVELLKNAELMEEYNTYIEALELIRSLGIYVSEEVSELQEFEFDPEIALMVDEFLSTKKTSSVKNKLSDNIKEIENSSFNKKTGINIGWFKAAAIYFVLTTLFISHCFFEKANKPIRINVTDLEPPYTPLIVRGETNFDTSYLKAICYYIKGHPDSALLAMSHIHEPKVASQEGFLLESVCLIELNKPHEAMALLQNVSSSGLYYSAALWHMAICSLMLNEKGKAEELLMQLKQLDPGYKSCSNKLLRMIAFRNKIDIIYDAGSYFSAIESNN